MKLSQKLQKSAAAGYAIALFLGLAFKAQHAPAQDKVNEPTQLKAEVSERAVAVQELQSLRQAWAKTMHHTPAPKGGCFHASYPSTQWEEVQCAPPPGYRSVKPVVHRNNLAHGQVGGDTYPSTDLVVQAPSGHFFTNVEGKFVSVNGVTSESSVGVAEYGGGGILGANEYTLQVNTNISHAAACGSYSACTAWQQYVMATNTPVSASSSSLSGDTEVFIEYWLFNYGPNTSSSSCPSGFVYAGADSVGADCVQNTPATVVYSGQLPITDLADLTLSGSAATNGTDEATVTYNGQAYQATVADNLTGIAAVWNQAEFNVVGNAGGSQAQFNNGTSLVAQVAVTDGSTSAPSCVTNGGTTGESNNLNFVPSNASPVCCPYGGANPSVEFMEVYDTSHMHTASCGSSSITGEPHVTTVNNVYYNFQAAGEFVALLDADGTQIQTRQTALPTVAPGNYDPSNTNNDGLVSCLAMNTAVAARVGTHRVTYEPSYSGAYGHGPFDLRIDGSIATLGAAGVNLGNGARVRKSVAGNGIEVDFSDGKILTAVPSGSYDSMSYLNVQFEDTGLLGDGNGPLAGGIAGTVPAGSWLPAMPNGASVGPMPAALHDRYETLYNTFGNAWRVTAANTLFDYAPGTSTATFTNAGWPVENAKTCTIPHKPVVKPVSLVIAQKACKLVTDGRMHSNCLFDVQATGNTNFATTYKASEQAHAILNIKPINAKLLTLSAR